MLGVKITSATDSEPRWLQADCRSTQPEPTYPFVSEAQATVAFDKAGYSCLPHHAQIVREPNNDKSA